MADLYLDFGTDLNFAPNGDLVGHATFSRFTANGSSPTVPVGATIQSNAVQISYQVMADASNPADSATLAGHPIPPDGTTVTATLQVVQPGSASNVTDGAAARAAIQNAVASYVGALGIGQTAYLSRIVQ